VIRLVRHSAVIALLAAASLASGAGAASAADPTPVPGSAVIHYDGTGTVSDVSGSAPLTYPVTWTVDCTGDPCTITGVLVDTSSGVTFPLTGGILQPFVGGTGTYSYAGSGDKCAGTWVGAYTLTIVATRHGITTAFDIPGGGQVDCAGGTSVQYDASHVDITTTVISGDTCYIFATCPTPSPTPVAIALVGGGSAAAAAATGTAASSPSTLSTLPTLASALSVANAAWAAVATTVLVVLIALPSHLINLAAEHESDRFSAWRRRMLAARKPREVVADSPAGRLPFAGWPLAAGGLLIASLISSFVNPGFGFNASSVRVFLSILASFLLDAAVGWFIVIWLVRRTTPNVTAAFRFVPATLVIVVAAVLFSRLTGFQPGIVFGLVAGVIFGSALAVADKAKVALVPLGYSFAAALVGWVGYSIMAAVVGQHPGILVLFVQETLAAVTIAGIAALPIALVPLRGLAGYDIFHWNRWVWGAAYAVGVFGFFFVLMPKPFSWGSVGLSIWVWGALFLLYALIGVGLWLLVLKPWRPATADTVKETAPIG
jgi:hypothetical protein